MKLQREHYGRGDRAGLRVLPITASTPGLILGDLLDGDLGLLAVLVGLLASLGGEASLWSILCGYCCCCLFC